MSTTMDFDRLLASVLDAEGPQRAPSALVEAALTEAGSVGQRQPRFSVLDRRAWPAPRTSLGHPVTARFAMLGLVLLLILALVAGAIGVGRWLVSRDAVTSSWTATGSMADGRVAFTATLLNDGRVLAVGGGTSAGTGSFVSAEIYEPASGIWTAAPPMRDGRRFHTATLLTSGMVLVAGGIGDPGASSGLRSAELSDPRTGIWTPTATMIEGRAQQAAVRLSDGKVLVAGGTGGEEAPSLKAEVYDPTTGTWTATGPMTAWRASPMMILLADNKVLVAGGFGQGEELRSAEVYDPKTQSWARTNDMHVGRVDGSTATLLLDGRVVVAGGPDSSAELYDPRTGTWTLTASMPIHVAGPTSALMPDGRVLVAGGSDESSQPVTSTQLYDPATASWSNGAPMHAGRDTAIAVPLPGGPVLVIGGLGVGGAALPSTEIYAETSGP